MIPQRNNARYESPPLPDDFPISTLGAYRENITAPAGEFVAGARQYRRKR